MFWVYILKCADNSYYTGHTDNLENRLMQHRHKIYTHCFTATRLPVELVFSQEFATREEALTSERQIKGWSRKKKEALIRGEWESLSIYAKRQKKSIDTTLRDGAKSAPPQGERI
jgi:putative endonuclease